MSETKAANSGTAKATTERKPRPAQRGIITSAKTSKTVRVQVDFRTKHPKYGKYIRRRTVLAVHDEQGEGRIGDFVEISECRPMSKTKHWRLVKVLRRGPGEITLPADPTAPVKSKS